jgi:rSAM/selenodomain-associated transferase 2
MNTVLMTQVDLSIIVPILNESEELPGFIENLQRQKGLRYQLIFVDGRSEDGSSEWLRQQLVQKQDYSVVQTERGRARQLNCGAGHANSEWLLFLHVDSRFEDPLALSKALACLHETASYNVAGHFALKFRRSDDLPSLGYYFYEWKARTGRPETIHGDQGLLLSRQLFNQLDGFSESMSVMEDTDFAERLRGIGQWRLLPAELSTSARRFEAEGLWQRQLLGALIMCFRDISWQQFFAEAPQVYRQQTKTERLRVRPFFLLIRRLLKEMDPEAAWRIWWLSGRYVQRHAWQLAFAHDARRAFRRGIPVGQGEAKLTRVFEPIYDLLTDNLLGRLAATLLLRLWFEATDLWLRNKERI